MNKAIAINAAPERSARKTLVGEVISNKMMKTIVVLVSIDKMHHRIKKQITISKSYKVHDPLNSAKPGDIVRIAETRPLSATKRFRLVEIIKPAAIKKITQSTVEVK